MGCSGGGLGGLASVRRSASRWRRHRRRLGRTFGRASLSDRIEHPSHPPQKDTFYSLSFCCFFLDTFILSLVFDFLTSLSCSLGLWFPVLLSRVVQLVCPIPLRTLPTLSFSSCMYHLKRNSTFAFLLSSCLPVPISLTNGSRRRQTDTEYEDRESKEPFEETPAFTNRPSDRSRTPPLLQKASSPA